MPAFDAFVSSAGGGFYDARGFEAAYGVSVFNATVALDHVEFIKNNVHISTSSDALVLARGCTFEGSSEYDWDGDTGTNSNSTLYTDTAASTLTTAPYVDKIAEGYQAIRRLQTLERRLKARKISQAPLDLFLQADDSRFTALRKVCPPHCVDSSCTTVASANAHPVCGSASAANKA